MTTLTLDEIVEKAKAHVITPAERRAQRISLIRGVLAHDSTLTRDNVATMLEKIEGREVEAEPEQRVARR